MTFDECYPCAQFEVMRIGVEGQELQALAEQIAKETDAAKKMQFQNEFKSKQQEVEKKREEHIDTAVTALERGLKNAEAVKKKGNDVSTARGMLALYYMYGRKYREAIRVGETFARSDPRSGHASRAAADALQAYSLMIGAP